MNYKVECMCVLDLYAFTTLLLPHIMCTLAKLADSPIYLLKEISLLIQVLCEYDYIIRGTVHCTIYGKLAMTGQTLRKFI